jgi:hypothetical protein
MHSVKKAKATQTSNFLISSKIESKTFMLFLQLTKTVGPKGILRSGLLKKVSNIASDVVNKYEEMFGLEVVKTE